MASAEVGGPGRLGGQDFGYWLYAEVENSGSYYRASGIDQALVQASFDMDVTDAVHIDFGGMFHDFTGNQIAGLEPADPGADRRRRLHDGTPRRPWTPMADGRISHQEFDVDGDGFTDVNPFAAGLVPGTTGVPG